MPAITSDPAVTVTARAETVPVGTSNEDAADDPAIWRNPADPAASLIVGTDKKGGLYVYDLTGAQKSFLPAPGMNNVDLVEIEHGRILVIASDRADLATAHLFLALLDPATASLAPAGRIAVGPGEGYGICIAKPAGKDEVVVFSAPKNGIIYRTTLAGTGTSGGTGADFVAATTTLATVASQPEGCMADPRTATLYIGEEAVGIWAIDMNSGEKRLVAPVDNRMLVADVEGLALAPSGAMAAIWLPPRKATMLYAVYRLPARDPGWPFHALRRRPVRQHRGNRRDRARQSRFRAGFSRWHLLSRRMG